MITNLHYMLVYSIIKYILLTFFGMPDHPTIWWLNLPVSFLTLDFVVISCILQFKIIQYIKNYFKLYII
jgi:hypothetical protein